MEGDAGVDRYGADDCRSRTPRTHTRKCVAPRTGSASMSSGASWSQAESSAIKVSAPRRISRPSVNPPRETVLMGIRKITTSPTSR